MNYQFRRTCEKDTGEEKFWAPLEVLVIACGRFEPKEWLADKCPKCGSKDLDSDVYDSPLISCFKDKFYAWYGETFCNNCKWEGDYMKEIDFQAAFRDPVGSA